MDVDRPKGVAYRKGNQQWQDTEDRHVSSQDEKGQIFSLRALLGRLTPSASLTDLQVLNQVAEDLESQSMAHN